VRPTPVDLSYLADGRAEEATAQPVVLVEKIVEPGELGRHATAHEEPVSALEAVPHAAIATIPPDWCVNRKATSQVTDLHLRLCGSAALLATRATTIGHTR
jgi:hypothetical protein